MARCLISFGANIGDALGTIHSAASRLREELCPASSQPDVSFRLSRCYLTPPVGGPTGQPPFINAVAAIDTLASPWDVWHSIRKVEKEFGRERNLRWEARRIDLDILLFGDVRIWTPHLKIPHPRMCMRRFILLPAVDVARDWIDPVSGWTVGQLAENVRQGPSNFVLLGEESSNVESLLAEAARRAGAQWRFSIPDTSRTERSDGRWVAAKIISSGGLDTTSIEDLGGDFVGWKLVIALAPAVLATDVAWEDYHHSLGCRLGLVANSNAASFGLGPRYLLPSNDRDWAIQELAAALEAMDCPIETL